MIDLLRICICIPFLLYACFLDLKMRRISNRIWLMMICFACITSIYSVYKDHSFMIDLSISVSFISILAYTLFRIGAFGGADAKSLISISALIPTSPIFELVGHTFPLAGGPMIDIFGLNLLLNAVLFSAFIPISLFIYNLSHLSKKEMKEKPSNLFIGYKLDKSKLQGKHVKILSESSDGDGPVWVMPLLPFMLLITIGFFSVIFYGSILDSIVVYLLT